MSRAVAFAVPGSLETPTGGYAYDRRVIAELRALGWQVDVVDLGEGFPRPRPEIRDAAAAMLAAVPAGQPIVVDGLAFGVLPEAAAALSASHPLIALVHHPLACESGLAPAEADALLRSERAALKGARRVIATSRTVAGVLNADYGVAGERIVVAVPGVDRVAPAKGRADGTVGLLAVGAVVPRKGYDILIAALATLPDLPWRLTIAGARDRDRAAVERLDADIARFGMAERVHVLGAAPAERLAQCYREADVFVLASRFEGFGMAFAEAVAYGLPVVGTTAGAIPEAVPEAAALLVPPEDPRAFADALRRLISDHGERCRLAAAARAAAKTLPTWEHTALRVAQAIEEAL